MTLTDYYQAFAEFEARGVSALYDEWASGVAGDPDVLALLEPLPGLKAQANLVFAAARWEGCPLEGYPVFRRWLLANWDATKKTVLAHSTQTNEAGRCATLLPQLSSIAGPIALLEVGASAGLCLYPDRYSYRYDHRGAITSLDPAAGPSPVVLPCRADETTTLPDRLPDVVWRGGIDLHPIDIGDDEEARWLEMLVWPGQEERLTRLRSAASIVVAEPPLLIEGDLLENLHAAVAKAPKDATLVVFHSAVLVYLTPKQRASFIDEVGRIDCVWLSNEGSTVLPAITAQVTADIDPRGRFILARDGRALALTGPHGQSIQTLPR